MFKISAKKEADANVLKVWNSFSRLAFASAAAASFQQVANHGIDIIPKYAIGLDRLQIAETHGQNHLHAAAKDRIL